jgi:REP element-mobilizing transposase RayT
MARRLRVQYEGAIYHVINRGNYRRDVFESAGTAKTFESTLAEACEHYRWRLHAYVIMRNRYHLALETPEGNLVEGMHWLQSTFATRFNRLRSERGHLFQGRYQALLVEDEAALTRVVDYIHLNPVRAAIVPVEQLSAFRWSSLARFLKPDRPAWLVAEDWLEAASLAETQEGLGRLCQRLDPAGGRSGRAGAEGLCAVESGVGHRYGGLAEGRGPRSRRSSTPPRHRGRRVAGIARGPVGRGLGEGLNGCEQIHR